MKLRFSYKNQLFMPMFAGSLIFHGALLGMSGFLTASPEFGVVKAPASVEVVLIEAPKRRQTTAAEKERVISLEKVPLETAKVLEEEKERPEIKIEEKKGKELPDNFLVQGARVEARPDRLRNPAPVYPRFARRRGWEGTVLLKVLVDREGRPSKVVVEKSSGHDVLDQSAVRSIKEWQFLPARLGDLTFSSWIKIPVRFVLNGD